MKQYLNDLDKAFENKVRLGIMSALAVNTDLDFTAFKELLNVTDGNLASHMKALEKVEYVEVKKTFIDRKPNTRYRATKQGLDAFNLHLDALEKLIKSTYNEE